jgi:hypothetical protein
MMRRESECSRNFEQKVCQLFSKVKIVEPHEIQGTTPADIPSLAEKNFTFVSRNGVLPLYEALGLRISR